MYVRAEVKCLNCGRYLGEATGQIARPLSAATITCASGEPCFSYGSDSYPRCRFCGGRAIVEDFDTVLPDQRVAWGSRVA